MSDISNEKLGELEKLAKAAGDWPECFEFDYFDSPPDDQPYSPGDVVEFWLAADPPTVLALIAELRRRRGDA